LRGDVHSNGAYCASACAFILAGGFHRSVAPWSRIGVHQVTDMEKQIKRIFLVRTTKYMTADGIVTHKAIVGEKDETRIFKLDRPRARTIGLIHAYLKEMGVSEQLQKLMGETDSKSIHWLTDPETETTALVTDYFGAESLLAKSSTEVIGPELPVTSLSWGVVSLPAFGAKRAKLLLEFIHRKDAPVVEFTAVMDNRTEFSAISQFGLVLQLGPQKTAAQIIATSSQPGAPLTTTLAVPQLCEALTKGQPLTLQLQDRSASMNTIPFLAGSAVFYARRDA
jgi:hypothetical protein